MEAVEAGVVAVPVVGTPVAAAVAVQVPAVVVRGQHSHVAVGQLQIGLLTGVYELPNTQNYCLGKVVLVQLNSNGMNTGPVKWLELLTQLPHPHNGRLLNVNLAHG